MRGLALAHDHLAMEQGFAALPLVSRRPARAGPAVPVTWHTSRIQGAQVEGAVKRILLVDDSRLLLKFEELCLRASYEVTTAASGSEALAKALSEHPDLVLTDLNLPDLSGRQVVESLALDGRTRGIKTV